MDAVETILAEKEAEVDTLEEATYKKKVERAAFARKKRFENQKRRDTLRKQRVHQRANRANYNANLALAGNDINKIIQRDNRHYKMKAIEEMRILHQRLVENGIKDFLPDAAVALLMCIKGYPTSKMYYNAKGRMYRTIDEFVGPNYQAAIAFLKHVAPEKYAALDGGNPVGDIYNIFTDENVEIDIARLSRLAGSLLESKMVECRQLPDGKEQPTDSPGGDGLRKSDTD